MNVNRLISEVQKRPALWDLKKGESKSRYCAPNLWKEVATAVGADVEQCKRKWKNLRDAYRAEVRRSERRVERDKLIGEYDPNTNYSSKWIYFEPLGFLNDSKRPRYTADFDNSTNSNEACDQQFHSICDIKMEPRHSRDEDHNHHNEHHFETNDRHESTDHHEGDDDDDDDEAANDMLFEEFRNIATPNAARRLSATISMTNSLEHNLSNDTSEKPSSENAQNDCNCNKRTEERVHFLEDLEKEEQKLMQSTSQDIKRAQDHVGDSDYNFLVSFLPQMKKMSDLQNLQFRARMCDLVLNIMAPTISSHNSPVPPPLTPAPGIAYLETLETPALTMPQLLPVESSITHCCEGRMPCNDNYNQPAATINAATSTNPNNMP